jgi:hypothetical protein
VRSILLAALLSASLHAATVEIRAKSTDTWIAWRGVEFLDANDQPLGEACIHQSSGTLPCANLANGNRKDGWSARDYKGSVTFRVNAKRRDIHRIILIPCCGDAGPEPFSNTVRIKVIIDGYPWDLGMREYTLGADQRVDLFLQ